MRVQLGDWTYWWDQPTRLHVGDWVLVPPPYFAKTTEPNACQVAAIGDDCPDNDYDDDELTRIIRKLDPDEVANLKVTA